MTSMERHQEAIYRWVEERTPMGGRVLDLGCGDGELLAELVARKQVSGTGIEIDEELIVKAVQRGLSVHHGNIEEGMDHYADGSFDLVIMSLTIQEMAEPIKVLAEAFRVGKQVIVVFPNFAYWRCRWQLGVLGQAPTTRNLPYSWFDTPNRHYCSVTDWERLCREKGWRCVDRGYLAQGEKVGWPANLRAEVAVYLMEQAG